MNLRFRGGHSISRRMTATVEGFELEPGVIYIREETLLRSEPEVRMMRDILSDDERKRADRFRYERHRRRFTVAHATLRGLLGRLVDQDPGALRFRYGEHGKPSLPGGPSFNLSHSGERMLFGVMAEGRLGVDVEEVRHVREMEALATKKFAPDEVRYLLATPPEDRREAFFRIWTRKEALLKALGQALSVALDSFSIDPVPDGGQGLVRIDDPAEDPSSWTVSGLACDPGGVAAIAVDAPDVVTARLTL